jgi:hypothetical protein
VGPRRVSARLVEADFRDGGVGVDGERAGTHRRRGRERREMGPVRLGRTADPAVAAGFGREADAAD